MFDLNSTEVYDTFSVKVKFVDIKGMTNKAKAVNHVLLTLMS